MSKVMQAVQRKASLTYSLFDPAPCNFPVSRVSLLPCMKSRTGIIDAKNSNFELVGRNRVSRLYTRGRYALYEAYRLCGVGPEGGLLAPAYHCRTMLDPAISLDARVSLYPLSPSLAPDLNKIEDYLSTLQQRPRAMLLTHYFGFPQDAATVKAFCDRHGMALIEDCSHALFNLSEAPQLGQHGRYTIASPYKLLPCEEGGLLIAADEQDFVARHPQRPGLGREIRTFATALTRIGQDRKRRITQADVDLLPDAVNHLQSRKLARGIEHSSRKPQVSDLYIKAEAAIAGSIASKLLIKISSLPQAVAMRRENYLAWHRNVQDLPHCKPLFTALPDGCVPYMFPLVIDFPQDHFYALKTMGMPIWRWDDMAWSSCSTAQKYRQHLLHLPCHQSLSEVEMRWMMSAVALVMTRVPQRGNS